MLRPLTARSGLANFQGLKTNASSTVTCLLPVRLVERPWGRERLPVPFVAPVGRRIGEVWFEPPRGFEQLLVKYIFTSEALSVQVHPSDAQAPGRGKEECWLVLDAEPGARIGVGFCEEIGAEAIRAAALDGSIEALLGWHEVAPGDFFYLPAGTVHAIGAGVSLIEVQQNSDVTYRLYDYGRHRDLHLDEGLAVARGSPHAHGLYRRLPGHGHAILSVGPPFRLDRIDGSPDAGTVSRYGEKPLLVVPLAGDVRVGGESVAMGNCGFALSLAEVENSGMALIAQPSST